MEKWDESEERGSNKGHFIKISSAGEPGSLQVELPGVLLPTSSPAGC